MNAAASAMLVADVETELSNVIPLKPAHRPDAERLADLHRREAHNCTQRIADAKRALKLHVASLSVDRKAEKARHEAAMAALAESEAAARERTAQSIAEDERLMKYNRAALDALAAE